MNSRAARVAVVVLSTLLLGAILSAGYWFERYDELEVRARLAAGDRHFESVREKAICFANGQLE